MSLTEPLHAVPGELLTSTCIDPEGPYPPPDPTWRVPNALFDISDHRVMLEYADLWFVVSSRIDRVCVEAGITEFYPAVLLHLPSMKLFEFYDMEMIGWLWRP